jgi:hypothetical protein
MSGLASVHQVQNASMLMTGTITLWNPVPTKGPFTKLTMPGRSFDLPGTLFKVAPGWEAGRLQADLVAGAVGRAGEECDALEAVVAGGAALEGDTRSPFGATGLAFTRTEPLSPTESASTWHVRRADWSVVPIRSRPTWSRATPPLVFACRVASRWATHATETSSVSCPTARRWAMAGAYPIRAPQNCRACTMP